MYTELHKMGCMNPGNEVFHVLDETPEVEVGKGREDNEIERRGSFTRQFWVGSGVDWTAVDVKILKLGCCGQRSGEDFW